MKSHVDCVMHSMLLIQEHTHTHTHTHTHERARETYFRLHQSSPTRESALKAAATGIRAHVFHLAHPVRDYSPYIMSSAVTGKRAGGIRCLESWLVLLVGVY
jgi:hypothetical protein